MSGPRIAVVVPAFNERESLPGVIEELRQTARARTDWAWRIFVVDDCSTDGTTQLLDTLARERGMAVIRCPVNIGIGGAVQAGFMAAAAWAADVTVQLDGDGQHPAERIPALVGPVLDGAADVVVGSRYLAGGGGAVSPPLRQLGTRLFSWLLRLLVGTRIKDVTSGFRAFNRAAADHVVACYADDYPEVEVLVPLTRLGLRVAEVPVEMKRRRSGRSSISSFGSVYYMVKVTLALLVQLIKPIPRQPRRSREP